MKADYIKTIITKMEELPYKTVLFDGIWGIGKSYAINEALEGNSNVCKISMFGLNDVNQIYHQILFQLVLKNSIGGKIANNILERLSSVWEKAEQAKEMISNIVKERELFLLLSKSFNSFHIVVIDDLERSSDKINLEELFGIVDELKQCPFVKIILVAYIKEIKNKKLFDKYSEKVIDRVYHITEMSKDINWGKLNIHAGFITEFLERHRVKNIRTLEKAQNFFDDVKIFCNNISDERFVDEIRLICFAIVVESTDNLYLKEIDENSGNPTENNLLKISNGLDHRILSYLTEIISSRNLVTILLRYYKNESVLDNEMLSVEYKLFCEAGNKANYFRTDEEIRMVLPNLEKRMNEANNLSELNRFADEYMIWSDILEEDNSLVLQKYRDKLCEMLQKTVIEGKEEILSYGVSLFNLSSDKIEKAYLNEVSDLRKWMIRKYVENLKKTTKGKQAFEYSYKLRKYLESNYYKDIIIELVDGLYNESSFPVGEIDETQYHTCYNIMYILYNVDSDKFLKYCNFLFENCDHMSAHRVDVLLKEIKGKR